MKHTKGKWDIFYNVRRKLLTCYVLINGNEYREICSQQSNYETLEENDANFKLISKAPKMYKVLKACEKIIRSDYGVEVDLYKKIELILKEIES